MAKKMMALMMVITRTMKILTFFGLSLSLSGCDGNARLSYYSNFTAKGEGHEYEISGAAQVVDHLGVLYISSIEDTDVNLSGELKSMSGELQIVYINQDNKETVIYDSSIGSQREKVKINTNIVLDKGEGCLEFRGKDTAFQFDLLFANIDEDKFEYFSAEENRKSVKEGFKGMKIENSIAEDKKIRNEDKLLKETSVTYTDKEDNCAILSTSFDKNTKLKVLIEARVSHLDDKESVSFGGFRLSYKTQNNNDIQVLNYEANEFAMGV